MGDYSLLDSTQNELDSTLRHLDHVWRRLQLTEEERAERQHYFNQNIIKLCEKIIEDEEALEQRVLSSIEHNTREILRLSEELNQDILEDIEGMRPLEQKEFLQEKLDDLLRLREERLVNLKALQEKDQAICDILGEAHYPHIEASVAPSEANLEAIEQHIKQMENEKILRGATFKELRAGVLGFLEQLEQSPDGSFCSEVVISDDNDVTKFITNVRLQELKALHSELEFGVEENRQQSIAKREEIVKLWSMLAISQEEQEAFLATAPKHTPSCIAKLDEELERLRALRLQNIAGFIERLEIELKSLYEECFVAEEDREHISADNEATEALLEQYEKAVARWESYKQQHNEIIKCVVNYNDAFDRLLFVEERQKDKNRLKDNRGGKLLQEEKELKRVKKDVPRWETRLLEAGHEWEQKEGKPFLIYGESVRDYIDNLWEKHDLKRETEKIKRIQAKANNLEADPRKGTPSMRPPSPRLTTPAGPSSSKRNREENENSSSKRLKTAMSGTLFPSPTKSMARSPTKTPSIRPLNERNIPAVVGNNRQIKQTAPCPKIVLSTSADTSLLHSTLTYDKFEDKLRHSNECLNSTTFDQVDFDPRNTLL